MNTLVPAAVLRRMRPALGTFVEIGVFDPGENAAVAVRAAFEEITLVERLMSFQARDSELTRLNLAGGKPTGLSTPTMRALRLARAMTLASGGLFNCTVGGALIARGQLPDHGDGHCIPIGTAADIVLAGNAARLHRPVRVTLDGIAKGLAVDRALARLRSCGIRHAWINAGGDLRVTGRYPLPVSLRGGDRAFALYSGALATSARDAQYDASMPGEIIDASGAAMRGEWCVLAAQAWRADALTKVAALAPRERRNELLARLGGRVVAAGEFAGARAA